MEKGREYTIILYIFKLDMTFHWFSDGGGEWYKEWMNGSNSSTSSSRIAFKRHWSHVYCVFSMNMAQKCVLLLLFFLFFFFFISLKPSSYNHVVQQQKASERKRRKKTNKSALVLTHTYTQSKSEPNVMGVGSGEYILEWTEHIKTVICSKLLKIHIELLYTKYTYTHAYSTR